MSEPDSRILPLFDRAADVPMVRVQASEFDHLVNNALDTYTDMSARDIVVQTVLPLLSNEAVGRLGPATIVRMLNILSRHSTELAGQGLALNPDDLDAGYKLLVHAQIPKSFLDQLRLFEERMEARLETYTDFRGFKDDAKLPRSTIADFARRFITDFAQAYEMYDVPDLKLINNPNDPASGWAIHGIDGGTTFEINLAHAQTLRDVGRLVITLGHESLHGYSRALKGGRANLNFFESDPDAHFAMMEIFNSQFYTQRPDVYFKHLEEILAETTGLSLAMHAVRALKLPVTYEDFRLSLDFLHAENVADIIKAKGVSPSAEAPPAPHGHGMTKSPG